MSRQIGIEDLEDIARGAAILGAGGGGDPYLGRLLAENAIRTYGPVTLVDMDELTDDAMVLPVAIMGAPTVIVEKPPAGTEFGAAVRALGCRRIALVSPYSADAIGRAKRYYETRYGLEVVAMEGFGATDAYAIGGLGADNATEAFIRIDRPDIEVLVVPGGNFPTMRHIATWERQFGKPVITTNQAALWAVMRVMKLDLPLPGLGRLLEQCPAG